MAGVAAELLHGALDRPSRASSAASAPPSPRALPTCSARLGNALRASSTPNVLATLAESCRTSLASAFVVAGAASFAASTAAFLPPPLAALMASPKSGMNPTSAIAVWNLPSLPPLS